MTNEVRLPESIRRQIAEASELERQLRGEAAPEGNTVASTSAPVENSPEVPAEPTDDAMRETPPKPGRTEDEKLFQRRYEVLEGKYRAEVPRLHQQLQAVAEQLQRAMAELQQLKQAPQTPKEAPKPDKDAEVFGEDLIEVIDRRTVQQMAEMREQMAHLRATAQQLEAKLGSTDQRVATSAQERFFKELEGRVPDYESVNADPQFLNWLGEADPIYGVPRQMALTAAAESLNADHVAAIFTAYKALTGKQQEPGSPTTQQRNRQELERQVAPSTSRSSAPAAKSGRLWTGAEYAQAYDHRNDKTLGEERAAQLRAEADAAHVEGRIRW